MPLPHFPRRKGAGLSKPWPAPAAVFTLPEFRKRETKPVKGAFLAKGFEYTAEVIRKQVSEISPREALIQPYGESHSVNWLLGHIVSSRSTPLILLNQAQVWDEGTRARYRDGSEPIGAAAPDVLPIDRLMNLFEWSQSRLIAGINEMTDFQLMESSGYGQNTVLDSLLYFQFHETYHVGQMTLIAELLGRRAKYLGS